MASKQQQLVPATASFDLMWAPMRLHVLLTALELNLFDALESGSLTPAQLARKIKAKARGVTMLLDELTVLGFLKKSGDFYALNSESRLYLVSSSPTYMGNMLQQGFQIAQAWENLTKVVRTGKPIMQLDNIEQGPEMWMSLVRGLYAPSYVSSKLLLPHLGLKRDTSLRVLDVAAGSAAWSIPFAEQLGAQVTVLDLPPVVEVAQEFIERHGLANQYDYLIGDLRKLNFGSDRFDVIILGHICHSEGARWSEKLISKCGKALRRGGFLVIPDMIPDNKRASPEFPLLFALNMLLYTTEGSTFTPAEYKQWLKTAGLKLERILSADTIGTQTIMARKP